MEACVGGCTYGQSAACTPPPYTDRWPERRTFAELAEIANQCADGAWRQECQPRIKAGLPDTEELAARIEELSARLHALSAHGATECYRTTGNITTYPNSEIVRHIRFDCGPSEAADRANCKSALRDIAIQLESALRLDACVWTTGAQEALQQREAIRREECRRAYRERNGVEQESERDRVPTQQPQQPGPTSSVASTEPAGGTSSGDETSSDDVSARAQDGQQQAKEANEELVTNMITAFSLLHGGGTPPEGNGFGISACYGMGLYVSPARASDNTAWSVGGLGPSGRISLLPVVSPHITVEAFFDGHAAALALPNGSTYDAAYSIGIGGLIGWASLGIEGAYSRGSIHGESTQSNDTQTATVTASIDAAASAASVSARICMDREADARYCHAHFSIGYLRETYTDRDSVISNGTILLELSRRRDMSLQIQFSPSYGVVRGETLPEDEREGLMVRVQARWRYDRFWGY